MYYGIDASAIQGNIDFLWLKNNGYTFTIFRNYIGNDFRDAMCDTNLAKAKAVGLKTGIYNFCYILPDAAGHANRNPEDQATLHFNNTPKGELVCVDLEWPSPDDFAKWNINAAFVNDWVFRYLEHYKQLSGLTSSQIIVYTYPYFGKAVNFRLEIGEYPLWYANYSNLPIMQPWTDWTIEQTSGGDKLTLPNGHTCDIDQVKDFSLWDAQIVDIAPISVPVQIPTQTIQVDAAPVQSPTQINTNISDTITKQILNEILLIVKKLLHIK